MPFLVVRGGKKGLDVVFYVRGDLDVVGEKTGGYGGHEGVCDGPGVEEEGAGLFPDVENSGDVILDVFGIGIGEVLFF